MPTMYTQVWVFCDMAGHYRRFIKDFTKIALPLYDVLAEDAKMGPVILSESAIAAVHTLKEKLMNTPVLAFLDFKKPFLLETDTSCKGLDAVLSQKQEDGRYHPIGYGS